jgi:hypothetical protein
MLAPWRQSSQHSNGTARPEGEEGRCQTHVTSTPRFHRAASAASSAWRPRVGGSISDAARHAGTSVAVTLLLPSTPARMHRTAAIHSCRASSRARTGTGTTKLLNTTRALLWRLPGITHSSSRFRDRTAVYREIGSSTSTELRPEAICVIGHLVRRVHHSAVRIGVPERLELRCGFARVSRLAVSQLSTPDPGAGETHGPS